MPRHFILALATALLATSALATTFIVPEDDRLIEKADAIVIGTIDGKKVQQTPTDIETVYDVRVSRSIKGFPRSLETIRIVSPGGHLGDRGVIVPGSAHFEIGDRVLLFLTRDRNRWTPTDMTLGKFRFETSTAGTSVLVRDSEDVFGFDRAGRMHVEHVRREAPFLQFIQERVAGRRPKADYFASAAEVVVQSDSQEDAIQIQPSGAPFPAPTYTDHQLLNGVWIGTRWEDAAATFIKRSTQNISGAADGGVSVIQNGLAAWTNEPGSTIVLTYGGQADTASAYQDGVSVVEFNDPQGRIGGGWTGEGTVATTFLSYFNPHVFPANSTTTWWSIRDADVVFQNGYTASNSSFATAMTHEIGHGIGFRHSNAHYIRPNDVDEPCQPAVEECSNSAIMYWQAISTFGFTLQTWDINAVQAVYPGGSGGAPGFYLTTPCRLIDTRNPTGPYGGPPLGTRVARNIVAAGRCTIPAGATAIAINVAAVTPPSLGNVIVYPGPSGAGVPSVSNLNFRSGETISNNAIVGIAPDGSINIYSTATSPMHVVIDVYGFFR